MPLSQVTYLSVKDLNLVSVDSLVSTDRSLHSFLPTGRLLWPDGAVASLSYIIYWDKESMAKFSADKLNSKFGLTFTCCIFAPRSHFMTWKGVRQFTCCFLEQAIEQRIELPRVWYDHITTLLSPIFLSLVFFGKYSIISKVKYMD